jgi:ankyrin repeat protein
VKYLVNLGANIHAEDDYALRWSAEQGHLQIVKFLVENGANVGALDNNALIISAQKGHLEVVKYLVSLDANIHAEDDYALQISAKYGHLEVVKYLMNFYTIPQLKDLDITLVNQVLKTWNYAAKVIQRGCHNWLYSPMCRDNTIGIVPRLEWQKIQSLI